MIRLQHEHCLNFSRKIKDFFIIKKWTLLFIIVTCRNLEAKFKYLKISFGQYIFFCMQKFVLDRFNSYKTLIKYFYILLFTIYDVTLGKFSKSFVPHLGVRMLVTLNSL